MDLLIKIIFNILWLCHVVQPAPRRPRLSIAEPTNYFYSNIDGDPNAYAFRYDVSDPAGGGSTQYRREERYPNGTVVGAYGYYDPLGTFQEFKYIADQMGFRVTNAIPSYFRPSYTAYTTEYPKVDPMESSITWSRPKRPSNKKTGGSNSNIQKKNPNIDVNYPPSFYVQYD